MQASIHQFLQTFQYNNEYNKVLSITLMCALMFMCKCSLNTKNQYEPLSI